MNTDNLTLIDGAISADKSNIMTKYNSEIETDGHPINERVLHATVFKEITPKERIQAAEDLDALIEDSHSELFGRDE